MPDFLLLNDRYPVSVTLRTIRTRLSNDSTSPRKASATADGFADDLPPAIGNAILRPSDSDPGTGDINSETQYAMHVGTLIYTWLNGRQVGTDEFGNRYFEARNGDTLHNRPRRWVLFRGDAEASKVPSEWHAWLHHMTADPMTDEAAKAKPWQKPHIQNMTGTIQAYRPKGHDFRGGQRAHATGDYEAWTPE